MGVKERINEVLRGFGAMRPKGRRLSPAIRPELRKTPGQPRYRRSNWYSIVWLEGLSGPLPAQQVTPERRALMVGKPTFCYPFGRDGCAMAATAGLSSSALPE